MNKEVQALRILKRTGILKLAAGLKKDNESCLTIVTYHRVVREAQEDFPFDEGVISSNQQEFQQEMEYIKKDFEVINFQDLALILKGQKKVNRPPLIVTFDDGYRDNFEIAFPILAKLELKATIFLATGFIGTDTVPWWDRVNCCIKKTERKAINFDSLGSINFQLTSPGEKRWAMAEILRRIKRIKPAQVCQALDELEKQTGIKVKNCMDEPMFMNWREVAEMSRAGIEFGSHTVTHAILENIDDEIEVYRELTESKKIIEEHVQKDVICFAFPGSGQGDLREKVLYLMPRTGYYFATSYLHGANHLERLDRFRLRRIGKESYEGTQAFLGRILLAQARL